MKSSVIEALPVCELDDANSQPWMAKRRVNPKGCEQDASNKRTHSEHDTKRYCKEY
jgi:hypothetical protein